MIYEGVDFEKLDFSKDEFETFEKYVKLKGVYLHKQVYDVLLSYNPDKVTYYELSSVIRYDKNLRDLLYKYLGTFEEYLKAQLFEKYDVTDTSYMYKTDKDRRVLESSVIENKESGHSNLYSCYQLGLGSTMTLLRKLKLYDKKAELNTILKLRNSVMHHNILVIGSTIERDGVEKNLEDLKKKVSLLCKYLPEEYRGGFKSDIEKLNLDRNGNHYLDKLVLEEIEWNM